MQVTNFNLNPRVFHSFWAMTNLGVLGNPEELNFNEIVGHPLIYLDGALEMSHSGFFPELEISINAAPCSVV